MVELVLLATHESFLRWPFQSNKAQLLRQLYNMHESRLHKRSCFQVKFSWAIWQQSESKCLLLYCMPVSLSFRDIMSLGSKSPTVPPFLWLQYFGKALTCIEDHDFSQHETRQLMHTCHFFFMHIVLDYQTHWPLRLPLCLFEIQKQSNESRL